MPNRKRIHCAPVRIMPFGVPPRKKLNSTRSIVLSLSLSLSLPTYAKGASGQFLGAILFPHWAASNETISMTIASFCRPLRDAWVWSIEMCFQLFPCLADPAKRSSWGLKLALLVLHLIFVGVLFLFDRYLIQKTKKEPWYIAIYLALFLATLFQYFFTSSSSPGYVLDAMRAGNEMHSTFSRTSATSKQPASRKNGSLNSPIDGRQLGRDVPGVNTTSWDKLVMEMHPLGSSSRNLTCPSCKVAQPPRSKHCHDCDKCVLQFDHHCVWLGTCIGQGNHCRFWTKFMLQRSRSLRRPNSWCWSGLIVFLLLLIWSGL